MIPGSNEGKVETQQRQQRQQIYTIEYFLAWVL
jgi:hypothetical protein